MKVYQIDRRPDEEKIAEKILGAAMLGTTVLVSPLAGSTLFFLGIAGLTYLFRKSDFNREAKRLQKCGYVALTKTGDGWLVNILQKGRERYRKIEIKNLRLPKSKHWDNKWRLFIFDIPEDEKIGRDLLSKKLKKLGMYNFQRSTFVYPYNCRDELNQVASYYRLDRYCTFAEVNHIDIDRGLRKYFRKNNIL